MCAARCGSPYYGLETLSKEATKYSNSGGQSLKLNGLDEDSAFETFDWRFQFFFLPTEEPEE
jgi:hypothetical protein